MVFFDLNTISVLTFFNYLLNGRNGMNPTEYNTIRSRQINKHKNTNEELCRYNVLGRKNTQELVIILSRDRNYSRTIDNCVFTIPINTKHANVLERLKLKFKSYKVCAEHIIIYNI